MDLTLYKKDDKLYTKTFFKTTDQNGYILIQSCYHPKWLKGIPKGQLMKIHQNCREEKEFRHQAYLIIARFREKRYAHLFLQTLKQNAQSLDRTNLLGNRCREAEDRRTAYLTNFNYNYKGFKKIIHHYRPILLRDNSLMSFLPIKPRFLYSRAPNLRDKLVHNVLDNPRNLVTFLVRVLYMW